MIPCITVMSWSADDDDCQLKPPLRIKEDFSRYIITISLTKTYPEVISMKKGNKLADWFIRKSRKSKPREIEKLISNTLLEKA